MGSLDGRVAIITGAGRGIGREHARFFAAQGARVVVNDPGGTVDGFGDDRGAAQRVVDEIRDQGGEALANTEDVTDFAGAGRLLDSAVQEFGDLHVLVNNAGILRDRMLVSMSEEEWDSVIRVHLKGHFAPTYHCARYWRARFEDGHQVRASVVNTTSLSGLLGRVGQGNYGAAKAGIATFTLIAAAELSPYGVKVNAVAPAARTRMTDDTPEVRELRKAPVDERTFDEWHPANISPLVAYLATESCPMSGKILFAQGGRVGLFQPWRPVDLLQGDRRWTVDELALSLPGLIDHV